MQKGNVITYANLKPRKLGGKPSEGMILCASKVFMDGDKICLLRTKESVEAGTRLHLEIENPHLRNTMLEPTLKSKKKMKIAEKVLSRMRLNDKAQLMYDEKWRVLANRTVVTADPEMPNMENALVH